MDRPDCPVVPLDLIQEIEEEDVVQKFNFSIGISQINLFCGENICR